MKTTIRQCRADAWAEADAMTNDERAEAGIATVYTPDRSERGYSAEADADCPCGGVGAAYGCRRRITTRGGSPR